MSIILSIAWFIFGFIIGAITIIGIACIVTNIREEKRNGENKES